MFTVDLETSRDLTCFIILVQQHELEWMGVDDSFGILCWHRVRQKLHAPLKLFWFEKKTLQIFLLFPYPSICFIII